MTIPNGFPSHAVEFSVYDELGRRLNQHATHHVNNDWTTYNLFPSFSVDEPVYVAASSLLQVRMCPRARIFRDWIAADTQVIFDCHALAIGSLAVYHLGVNDPHPTGIVPFNVPLFTGSKTWHLGIQCRIVDEEEKS